MLLGVPHGAFSLVDWGSARGLRNAETRERRGRDLSGCWLRAREPCRAAQLCRAWERGFTRVCCRRLLARAHQLRQADAAITRRPLPPSPQGRRVAVAADASAASASRFRSLKTPFHDRHRTTTSSPTSTQASNKASYAFLAFFLAAAGALWGVGLARLVPLVRALIACVQEEALAYAADPQWCIEPFTSLATVPLILTGAGFLAALGAFIILCFFCCCSVRPRGSGAGLQQQQQYQPQFLAAAAPLNGSPHAYGSSAYDQQHRSLDPEAGGATYWDEKAGRLVPGPGPAASPLSAGRRASGSHASGGPVVPVAAYAPPVGPFVPPSPVGEPIGSARDYPQVTPSV